MPSVYADFQNLDDDNRLRLTCAGTINDLKENGIELREGLRLTFYTDDADDAGNPNNLLVDGVVRRSGDEWVAEVGWDALKREGAT